MPRTTNQFELVINSEVCQVELNTHEKGPTPIYNVIFKGEWIGEVTRIKQNCWHAKHYSTEKYFWGRVRQECVTTMITSIYKE